MHKHTHRYDRFAYNMCLEMCIDMRAHTCVDVCRDRRIDKCIDMCIDK